MPNYLDNVNRISELLDNGNIILCPTDTIWGISCNAFNQSAVSRIYALKQRDLDKSCILLVDSIAHLKKYIKNFHPRIETLISLHNKPLTVIHEAAGNLPKYLTQDDGTIAIRITSHPLIREVIAMLGKPIISTSANIQGVPSPKSYSEISKEIRDKVDYICYTGREDNHNVQSSRIIKYSQEGELFFLR